MKKTKFKVDILKMGNESEQVLRMIANHNAGTTKIDLDAICGYLKARAAMYPTIPHTTFTIPVDDLNTINLSDDDGESVYLSITECTFEELVMDEIIRV